MSVPICSRHVVSVASTEHDVLDDVIRSLHESPDDAYWARRLFDLVRDPVTAMRVRHHLVLAALRFAQRDPMFFVHERYLSEQLAVWAWPREVLAALEERLSLDDPSLTHFILGRLWLEARRPPEAMAEFYDRAAKHLRAVEPRLQLGTWHESLCEALSVASPKELGERATAVLASVPEASRERVILAILRGAARVADWTLYDTHRLAYGGMNASSEISRLDGLRAEEAWLPTRRASATIPRATILPPSLTSAAATVRPPSRGA